MTTQYNWTISQLQCLPKVGDLTDYCVVSHWQCTGTDGEFTGQVYSTVSFPIDPEKPDFTPYADITLEQAIQWTQEALGEEQVAAVYTSIDTQIETARNPPIISPPLPWVTPAPTV